MSKDGKSNGDSTYLLVYPDRRQEKRKVPNGEIQDPAKLRKSPRKKPQIEIHGRVWAMLDSTCEIIDLSHCGIRIRTKVNLVQGEEVGLHLLVPETKDSIKQTAVFPTCQVVWAKSENDNFRPPYNMGLKILQMTPNQAKIWQSFVDGLPELKLNSQPH